MKLALINPSPRASVINMPDEPKGYAIFLRKFTLILPRCAPAANLRNLSFFKFRFHMGRSTRGTCASFVNAVRAIVRRSSKKQMRRAEARWIVAPMAYLNRRGRSIPIGHFIGDSVRPVKFACDPYVPVSTGIFRHIPLYTRVEIPGLIGIITQRRYGLANIFNTGYSGTLKAHLRALHGSWCMALAALERCGATSILAHGGAL